MPAPKTFKPMLAASKRPNLEELDYPVLVSPKLDGIRCVIRNGQAVSRKLKRIPNQHIQRELCGLPDGLDGELMVIGEDDFVGFNAVQSAVMSQDGESNFVFFVFDWDTQTNHEQPYAERLAQCERWHAEHCKRDCVLVVEHTLCETPAEVEALELSYLEQGFEGAMIRCPKGPYKYGRSTLNQGWLLKLKQFVDEEATVIGVEEQMHNTNEATTDELGHTKRSTHKEGMEPMGTLGKFVLQFPDGAEFRCGGGPGMTHELRQQYWDQRDELIGKTVTIKHQPDPGGRREGQAPRIPQFLGFRKDL